MASHAPLKMVHVISLAGPTALLAHGRRQMTMHNEDKTGRIYMVTKLHDIQEYDDFPNGTSLQGYVTTTYRTLKDAFGIPHIFDGDKTNVEWVLLIDGVLATIYDWKEDRVPHGEYQWHIGGHSTNAVELVQSVLDEVPS